MPSRSRGRARDVSGRRSTAGRRGPRLPRRPPRDPDGWIDPHACSLVGCDLGQWYRVGWAPTSPSVQTAPVTAPPAPRVDRAPLPSMTCLPAGDPKRAAASSDERSPDDLGLGASKVAVADAKGITDFVRLVFPRRLVGAVRDTDPADATAARAIVHGPATQPGDDRLVVTSFNHDAMSLVRQVAFVPAFDPTGPVRRGSIAMRDLFAASRVAGAGGILRDDPVPSAVVPVTPRGRRGCGRSPRPDCRRRRVVPARRHDPRVEATRRVRGGARRGVAHRQRCSHRRRRSGVAGGGLVGKRPRSAPGVHGRAGHGVRDRRTPDGRPLSGQPRCARGRTPGRAGDACAPRREGSRRRPWTPPYCSSPARLRCPSLPGRLLQRPTIRPAKRTEQAGG